MSLRGFLDDPEEFHPFLYGAFESWENPGRRTPPRYPSLPPEVLEKYRDMIDEHYAQYKAGYYLVHLIHWVKDLWAVVSPAILAKMAGWI